MRQRDTSGHHHHYHHYHHLHYQARSDDQGGERLIRQAPFPSAPSPKMEMVDFLSAPAMLKTVETVDNHGAQSFDLTPLPRRRHAEHGPQSFDLIPLPHRGSATSPKTARLPSLSAPAHGLRQGRRGGAAAGDASKGAPESSSPGGEPLSAIRGLIRRAPFPSAPAMLKTVETVDNHGAQSFDLTPLPRRRHAEHGPQGFDLLPLPNRVNTTLSQIHSNESSAIIG